ncbi:MAG: phytanoyl-CoA dioxygenase family protein [Saprospiraceae bacterium]
MGKFLEKNSAYSQKEISEKLDKQGFVTLPAVFSEKVIDTLLKLIKASKSTQNNFAIRQFFETVPEAKQVVFNTAFQAFLKQNIGENYFLIKAIYFDKPPAANWIVPWHQDLTITTNQKVLHAGYAKWRLKNGVHYVHPPIEILENIVTIRIHLDNCSLENGALSVIPGSHRNGIDKKLDFTQEKPVICEVEKGGLLLMKPLLFHASKRTTNNLNRRVIHLEFANTELMSPLTYRERIDVT